MSEVSHLLGTILVDPGQISSTSIDFEVANEEANPGGDVHVVAESKCPSN